MSDFVFYNRATPRDIRNTLRGGCSNSFTRGLHLETPFQLFILTQPRNINLFCTLVYRKLQRGKLCSRTLFWQGREEAALFFHWTSSRSGTLDPVKPSFVNHWTIHEHVWKWDFQLGEWEFIQTYLNRPNLYLIIIGYFETKMFLWHGIHHICLRVYNQGHKF